MTTILVVYVLSLILILSELLMPSFILGISGLIGLCGSTYWAFRTEGPTAGIAMILVAVAIVPMAIFKGMRRMALNASVDGTALGTPQWQPLAGSEGTTLTPLRPTGVASVDGKRVDVVTRGEPVDKGAAIRILAVEGNRIIVGPVERRS